MRQVPERVFSVAQAFQITGISVWDNARDGRSPRHNLPGNTALGSSRKTAPGQWSFVAAPLWSVCSRCSFASVVRRPRQHTETDQDAGPATRAAGFKTPHKKENTRDSVWRPLPPLPHFCQVAFPGLGAPDTAANSHTSPEHLVPDVAVRVPVGRPQAGIGPEARACRLLAKARALPRQDSFAKRRRTIRAVPVTATRHCLVPVLPRRAKTLFPGRGAASLRFAAPSAWVQKGSWVSLCSASASAVTLCWRGTTPPSWLERPVQQPRCN
jgi:hypothetical protein